MYLIKMESDRTLVSTIRSPVYQGDNGANTLNFLVPKSFEDIEVSNCTVTMCFILPSGIGNTEILSPDDEPYSQNYSRYRSKISSSVTKEAGGVELWLSFLDVNNEIVFRTSPIIVKVSENKNISDYFPDDKKDRLDDLAIKVEKLEAEKADNLVYDKTTRYLQLSSDDNPIGDYVVVPADDFTTNVWKEL
jgi:hypothetical protein